MAPSPAQRGLGPGGGDNCSSGVGASHAVEGRSSSSGCTESNPYGNIFLAPLVGGSGGGGSTNSSIPAYGDSGGVGVGAILIASSVSIEVNGQIIADGGDRTANPTPGGGPGSGGTIHLISPVIEGNGTFRTLGGTAIIGRTSYGRIRLEAFEYNFTGIVDPAPNLGTPYTVFLPQYPPAQVRVISVSGVLVPDLPTGNFTAPDVTINATGTTTFQIEARYVPLGSVVQLYAYSENGPDLIVDSTPLVGTIELSTAVMAATLPSGYSRVFVRSDWTPWGVGNGRVLRC